MRVRVWCVCVCVCVTVLSAVVCVHVNSLSISVCVAIRRWCKILMKREDAYAQTSACVYIGMCARACFDSYVGF